MTGVASKARTIAATTDLEEATNDFRELNE